MWIPSSTSTFPTPATIRWSLTTTVEEGCSGSTPKLVYRAPNTGEYFIVVTDAVGDSFGGYYLSVEQAREGTETVHVPTGPQLVEGQVVDSPFGEMLVFDDPG